MTHPSSPTDFVWLYGIHAVQNALGNPQRECRKLMMTQKAFDQFDFPDATLKNKVQIARMEDITRKVGEEARHQGIIGLFSQPPTLHIEDLCAQEATQSVVVVLDQVTDPHNMGAIVRSAAAFGAQALIVTERHSASTEGILAKTASGALELVPIIPVTNLKRALDQLKDGGYWCIGFDERGTQMLHQTDLSLKIALVMGAEGAGLRRLTKETCDLLVKIPVQDQFSTLNVSNSAAIALYEVMRQKQGMVHDGGAGRH